MKTKKTSFRSLEKEAVTFQLPKHLARLVRKEVNGYRTISVVGTEIVARNFGLDPADFHVHSGAAEAMSN